MFNLLHFVKTVFSNETPATNFTVLQTTLLMRSEARPTASAIVTRTIEPGRTGQVKFQGSWWTARCHSGAIFLAGDTVQVMHRQNLTLYVEPLPLPMMTLQQTTLLHYQSMAEPVFF